MLIRRAARMAARSGGDLLAVHITRPGAPADAGAVALAAQRQLTESIGGTYHLLTDRDIPAALLIFAHAENAHPAGPRHAPPLLAVGTAAQDPDHIPGHPLYGHEIEQRVPMPRVIRALQLAGLGQVLLAGRAN